MYTRRFRRRRRHVRRHAPRRLRRRSRIHPRRRRVFGKTFHLRFHKTTTVDFPKATNTANADTATLGWNLDHQYFTLEEFIKEAKKPGTGEAYTSTHYPPFRYYRIRKIVFKGKWINQGLGSLENVLGNTALDLDGEDEGRGTASKSSLDPKKAGVTGGPLTYDPLMNRSSKRAFNARSGFTRIFRPQPQLLCTLREGGGMFSYFFGRKQPWVSVQMGSTVHWQGLSVSMRQWLEQHPVSMQYDITAYVQFKEFDYETGTQKILFK